MRCPPAPTNCSRCARAAGSSNSASATGPLRRRSLVTAFRWDTGVQVTTGWKVVEVTAAITNGTTSNPRVSDDNSGKQLATRVTVEAAPGLEVGSSFARGQFVSRTALSALGLDDGSDFVQLAHGLDVEYSRGHWLASAEAIASEWRVPLLATERVEALRSLAVAVEGRYAFLPGAYPPHGLSTLRSIAFRAALSACHGMLRCHASRSAGATIFGVM